MPHTLAVLDRKKNVIESYDIPDADAAVFAKAATAARFLYLERFADVMYEGGVPQGECPALLREVDALAASPHGKRLAHIVEGIRRVARRAIAEDMPLVVIAD
jgi:hypothetical protein